MKRTDSGFSKTVGRFALIAGLGLGSCGITFADGDISPYTATYEFSRSGLKAERTVTLSKAGGGFTIETATKAQGAASLLSSGTAREVSKFRLVDGVVVPDSYKLDDGSKKADKDAEVKFDWNSNQATGVSEGHTTNVPIKAGEIFDPLTMELAVRQRLAAGEENPVLKVMEGSELRTYTFTKEGEEKISTGAGSHDTIRYKLDRESRRKTWYWFEPSQNYMVVKTQQRLEEKVKGTVTLKSIK